MKRLIPFAFLALAGCEPNGLRACDEAIKQTLKAPSTFKRISYSGPVGSWKIEYDAVNSFNAPLRGRGTCMIADDGSAVWLEDPS